MDTIPCAFGPWPARGGGWFLLVIGKTTIKLILMKKQYTNRKRLIVIASFGAVILASGILYAFSRSVPNSSTEQVAAVNPDTYSVPDLLQRDKNLSYDEFLKIREKYDKLSADYQADPASFDNLLKLSEIFIFEARVTGEHPYYYSAALKTLNELLRNEAALTPDQHFNALFYKATVQLSQHNFNDALVTGKKALALNNTNSGIYGVMVDANVEIGNYAEAVKYSDKMIAIRPDLRSYSRISYLREIYGDLDGSIASMKLAINAGAPYSEYKCWTIVTMGKLYEDHNQLDSAAAYYTFATQERENYPFGIAGLASIAAKKGDYAKADELYKQALNALPEISFTMARARLYKQQGKWAEMNELVPEIETMFKEDIASGHNADLEYAQFLIEFKKDYGKAIQLALKEYEKRPDNIDVNRTLAFAYYGKGDLKKAAEHAAVAMKTNKQDAETYCIAGLAKKDAKLVAKSFKTDPYQDHAFVADAKKMK
jgi:tetratricopeptide (TPR) repeat protein